MKLISLWFVLGGGDTVFLFLLTESSGRAVGYLIEWAFLDLEPGTK